MTKHIAFTGSLPALVTPFKNGSLDEAAFRSLVNWQISEGTHGLVPVGTTGESPTLTHAEHRRVVDLTVRRAAVLVPIVERPEGLTVLLTQRTAHLNNHGGQISFPGGRVEGDKVIVKVQSPAPPKLEVWDD